MFKNWDEEKFLSILQSFTVLGNIVREREARVVTFCIWKNQQICAKIHFSQVH